MPKFEKPVFLTRILASLSVAFSRRYTPSMLTWALEQPTASVVLLLTVVVVVLVSWENHPMTSVAIATVNAMSRTAAISGEIPFFVFFIKITYPHFGVLVNVSPTPPQFVVTTALEKLPGQAPNPVPVIVNWVSWLSFREPIGVKPVLNELPVVFTTTSPRIATGLPPVFSTITLTF